MEPAELPTWATEETAAPVEPVIIHAAPGEKDAAIAAASQSATEDAPKRSWLWAATLATWGLITQVRASCSPFQYYQTDHTMVHICVCCCSRV